LQRVVVNRESEAARRQNESIDYFIDLIRGKDGRFDQGIDRAARESSGVSNMMEERWTERGLPPSTIMSTSPAKGDAVAGRPTTCPG
jgi:hypothetical protein